MREREDDQIKVLLVDDHALFREGVVEIFAAEEDLRVVGEAENGAEAVALAEIENPDVVLLDVEMPVMGAEGAIEGILRVSPSSQVLVLTMYDEPRLVRRLLGLGAHAYIVNLLRNSDATSDKTPLPRLFFLFALRPYQLSLPKCR